MDAEITQLNNLVNEKEDLIQNLKAQINLMFNIKNFENNIKNKMDYNNKDNSDKRNN